MVTRTLGALLGVLVLSVPVSAQEHQLGKQIFEKKGNCFTCHGTNATGTPLAPNLRDSVWLNVDGSLAQIIAVVKSGVAKPKQHPAPMPPMGGAKLKDAEIDAVARYILSLGKVAATSQHSPMGRCAASSGHAARTERPPHRGPAWATTVAHGAAPWPGNPRCARNRMQ